MLGSIGQAEETYQRRFGKDEIQAFKEQHFENVKAIAKAQEKLDEAKAAFKQETAPLVAQNRLVMENVKMGYEEVRAFVHRVPDVKKRVMELFDDEGNKVGERPLRREEQIAMNLN